MRADFDHMVSAGVRYNSTWSITIIKPPGQVKDYSELSSAVK